MARPGAIPTGITALALLLALPVVVVVAAPLFVDAPEWSHVAGKLLPGHLGETLLLLAGTIGIAWLFAVPSAWLIAAHDFPLRNVFRWALVLPLALPTYISAYAYAALLGPTGTLSGWLDRTIGLRPDIMNMPGLCFVLAAVLFPYIHLPARAAFTQGMTAQLQAARMLGASPLRRLSRIAFPLARPAIIGGALLAAMETLNDFGAVKHYGIRTLTTGIFRSWSGLYDLGSALRLSAALLGLVALLLWIEQRSRSGRSQAVDQAPVARTRLVGWRGWCATLACALIVLCGIGLPLGNIIHDLSTMGASAWPAGTLPALRNTIVVALLAGACTLGAAILFAFQERYGSRRPWMRRFADLGYAIPGAVIAIGVMTIAGIVDRKGGLPFALIGSVGLLTYAFTVRFLAVGVQPLYGNLRQQSPLLDGSARLLGASPWRAFRRINLPLLKPALAASALLVAIDVVKELPLTLILRPFDMHTLSTKTYEMASIEQLREASAPAFLIVLCGLPAVLLLSRVIERHR
ncbi:MAG: iron ABC transporter permease [Flavobacteriales bacterium]|nr:iron ABC transporter permease [Flavobacteriales bacterium]